MYFVEADISEKQMRYKRTKLLTIIEEFKKSGVECARVVDHDYKTQESGRNALNQAIKRYGINGVCVFTRNNEIYLVRVDV